MNTDEKRVSAQKMVDQFEKLSFKEQERLFYMMQGVALVSEMSEKRNSDQSAIEEKVVEQI